MALVHVSLSRHEASAVRAFVRSVLDQPEVLQCFATTGESDYILRVVTRDMSAYHEFLNRFLFQQSVVVQVNTSVVMHVEKDSCALPL